MIRPPGSASQTRCGVERLCYPAMLLLVACAQKPVVQPATEPTLADLAAGQLPAPVSEQARIDRAQAIRAYRDYLARYPASAERHEIQRRLADLLVASASDTLAVMPAGNGQTAVDASAAMAQYREAIAIYDRLLQEAPADQDRGEIYYQLSRACEETGQSERAVAILDELIARYPPRDVRLYADTLFRRGELQFDLGRYVAAEASYRAVVELGETAPFYEQSLYKLGWSLFRQARYLEALDAYIVLLDRKLPAGTSVEDRLAELPAAEREQLDDVFRAISLGFSYLEGAGSVSGYFARSDSRHYEAYIYRQLAALYDSKQLYTDAAQTRLVLAQRSPDSVEAPRLYGEVIAIDREAGFTDRLIETHVDFVTRFGLDSAFWENHMPAQLPDVIGQLQASLIELAEHYHAAARAHQQPADYRQAEHWYRSYLRSFPATDHTTEMQLLLAELLYAEGDYAQATGEYELAAAAGDANAPQAAGASLNAVLACERHLQQAAGPVDKASWQAHCQALAIRFIEQYPQHPDAEAVLTRTGTALIEQQQAVEVIRLTGSILDRGEDVPAGLSQAARVLLAQAHFSRGEFHAAEQAYREALSVSSLEASREAAIRAAMAAAIYRQAQAEQARGNQALASRGFMRAAGTDSGASVRPLAQYDAAASLLAEQRWDEAAGILEQFRSEYPEHPLQAEALRKLAYARAQGGREGDAAGLYVRLAGTHEKATVRREALLQAADLYEQAGAIDDAVATLERYLERYPQPAGEALEVMQRLAVLESARGDDRRHRHWLQTIIRVQPSTAGDERSRELAARARLGLADYRIAEISETPISEPLQRSLAARLETMQLAIDELEAAAGYGVAQVIAAANYRIGSLYRDLGRALLASERPRDLDAQELAHYELLLEEEAAPFDNKAIEFHEGNLRLLRTGYYDPWVEKSLSQLGELWPARYARQEVFEMLVEEPIDAADYPDYPRAMALMRSGQYAGAAGLLQPLADAKGAGTGVQLNLAIALTRMGRNSEAAAVLQGVLAAAPGNPAALNLLGIQHRRAGALSEARVAYEQALRLRPDYAMAHINLGILCELYLGESDCAMRHYREFQRVAADERPRVSLWIADIEQRQALR